MNLKKQRKRKNSIQKQYDKTAKNLPSVGVGDHKYFQSLEEKEWSKSEITKKIGINSCITRAAKERMYKRNRVNMQKNLEQKLNHTTYDNYTFSRSSQMAVITITSANNNSLHCPMKRTHMSNQLEPTRHQSNPIKKICFYNQ